MKLSTRLSEEENFILSFFTDRKDRTAEAGINTADLDWNFIFKLLQTHKLLRSFAHLILDESESRLSERTISALQRIDKLAAVEKKIYFEKLELIKSLLEKAGIELCLLKGFSLGSAEAPRDVNDLDLLIKEKDIAEVHRIMLENGFTYKGDDRKLYLKSEDLDGNIDSLKNWTNQFEYLAKKDDLLTEIHTHPFERSRVYSFNLDKLWLHSDLLLERAVYSKDLDCRILTPSDNLWLICMHNAFRRSVVKYKFTLRYILDMKYLCSQPVFDWKDFLATAEITDTVGFSLFSLEMLEYFFSGTVPETVIITLKTRLRKSERFFRLIQHGCLHSMTESKRTFTVLYSILLPFVYGGQLKNKVKSIFIIHRIFKPPVKRFFRGSV